MCFEEGYEAKKKVLVADDDGINRRVLRRILSREYQVVEACNGQEALEMLSEDGSIAAVLLDLHMPVMDGYELLDVIRSDEKLYQLPVLALTAADANTAKEQVIRAGADDFLIKPVAPSVMLRRLETAILLQSSPDQGAAKILDALPFGVWLFDETTGQRIYALSLIHIFFSVLASCSRSRARNCSQAFSIYALSHALSFILLSLFCYVFQQAARLQYLLLPLGEAAHQGELLSGGHIGQSDLSAVHTGIDV